MNRHKRLYTLLGLLAAVSIATFALTHYEEKQEEIKANNAVILEIAPDTVTEVSWEYEAGGGLSFHKDDTQWIYEEDENFPVSSDKMLDLLSELETISSAFVIENVEDYGQYGLDNPEATLILTADEQDYTIKLGDFSTMDEQRYVDIGDGNVYLVTVDPLEAVSDSLSSYIQHDSTPGFETVIDITFSGTESYTIVRTDDSTDTYNSEEDIYFVTQSGKTVPLDTDNVKTYLNTISTLDLFEYVTYNASEEDLAAYGLDDPMLSVTVNYTYTDDEDETVEDQCILHIGENREERAEADEAIEKGKTANTVTKYVRVGESPIIYTLDEADFIILEAASYNELRHDEVFWADFDTVTKMEITLEGETHTLVSELNKDDEREWYFEEELPEENSKKKDNDETLEPLKLSDFEDALLDLSAESFTDESPEKEEEIRLTLYLDNEHFPTVEITLYRYDGSSCLAVVDGETISLVSRTAVMDLVEAVQTIVLN